MKKLSMVMAAAMCLTVGGVYATWNYPNSNNVSDHVQDQQVTIQMGDIDDTGAAVSIRVVEGKSNCSYTIDGETIGGVSNSAVLTPVTDSGITIRVAINKTSAVTNLQLTYTLTLTNATYDDGSGSVDIFTTTADSFTVDLDRDDLTETDATNTDVIYKELTYTAENFVSEFGLDLTEAFYLPQKEDYDNFQEELKKTSMYINVSIADTTPAGANV